MYKKPVGQGVMVLNQKHFFPWERWEIEVNNYRDNEKTCRCRLLFEGFLKIKISACKCCDVCANDCKCGECSIPTCDIPDKFEREDGEEF